MTIIDDRADLHGAYHIVQSTWGFMKQIFPLPWADVLLARFMLVTGRVMGAKKTAVFCSIIVVLSTIAGMIYGVIAG